MAGVRFEDVDLLGALSRIVDLHTQHYKEDFEMCIRDRGYIAWIEDQAVLPLQ